MLVFQMQPPWRWCFIKQGTVTGALKGRGTGVGALKVGLWASHVAAKGVQVPQMAADGVSVPQKSAELWLTKLADTVLLGLRYFWTLPSSFWDPYDFIVHLFYTRGIVEP